MRKRIFDIIQIDNKNDIPSRIFDFSLTSAIIINILVILLETFDYLSEYRTFFHIVEAITTFLFCIEYTLRLWTADFIYPKSSKIGARFRFIFSYDGIVELFTILPFFFLSGFIAFRILRVVRIFRLFRINTQYDSFNVITSVLFEKKNQILSSIFIILILMLASSLGIYNAEHNAQPEAFQNAFSGLWWSLSTMLTVGYGDIYPITTIGKIMAMFIELLGVGVVAIPTGIISAGFVEQYTKKQNCDTKFIEMSEIGEILVDDSSKLLGKSITDIQKDYDLKIFVILRSGLTIVPTENLTLIANDILIVQSDKLK